MARRRQLLIGVATTSTIAIAGCSNSADSTTDTENSEENSTESSDEEQPDTVQDSNEDRTQTVPDGEPITVEGKIADFTGGPIDVGEIIILGKPEGLSTVEPDSRGHFELELTSGRHYKMQYTQGADQYPEDEIPDLYTIDTLNPVSNVDLGEISLPKAHMVEVIVETADGKEVTDKASVIVSHMNNGTKTGFELINNPIELTGKIILSVTYDDSKTTETFTITSARSVTVTV